MLTNTILANVTAIALMGFSPNAYEIQSSIISPSTSQSYSTKQLDNIRPQDRQNIQALIDANLKALHDRDLEGYMNTMHPDSPQLESTRNAVIFSFNNHDLRYQIQSWEIVELSDEEAQIRVTQTTKEISGAEFRDNQIVIIHELKKYQDQWKFFTSEVRNIEFLD